ncbi:MAG: tRNA 2-thiouridine(34) synthase MnmA [Pseudomonadota bacterium]
MNIYVAMSGGVDSATAAARLLEDGHRVTGVTMRLWDGEGASDEWRQHREEEMAAAAAMSRFLGIKHEIADFRSEFLEKIVRRFCDAYLEGRTPNPCVLCNELIKFGLLLDYVLERGAEAIATGHYARVAQMDDLAVLRKGVDESKDQSYFLHRISQARLRRVFFPLGSMRKEQTRELAGELGLESASRAESQEICFVPEQGYRDTVERFGSRPQVKGEVAYGGKVLYGHEGIHCYTVGQRCGAACGGVNKRLFVKSIDAKTGRIEAVEKKDVYFDTMAVAGIVWHAEARPDAGAFEADVKIRYRHEAARARVVPEEGGRAVITFEAGQVAITPGQAAVFYNGDRVIGGGWIESAV